MQLTQAYLFLSSANPVLFALERMREEERQKDKMNIKFITMLFWGFHRCLISSCVQPHTHTLPNVVQLMFAEHFQYLI